MLKLEKPFPLGRGWGRLRKALPFREGLGVGFWKVLPFREGFGVGFWKVLPFREGFGVGSALQKSNNFEPIFSDLTLTFLTFGNTFRLPILPSRRIILLCLPQILLCLPLIFLCLPLIFLCLPLIFPGCAPKTPILKGKWRKKGGAEAPPISLYKYNTFRRQKQEVLKPKNRLGCGKFWRRINSPRHN